MTKNAKLIIITISIIMLIALFPISITAFAYGMGSYTVTWLYMGLYPTLIVAIFLAIRNVNLGYYLLYFTALTYSILFLKDVEKYLMFDIRSESLLYVLFLPFIGTVALLALIPHYLLRAKKFSKYVTYTAILLAGFILLLPIISSFDGQYTHHLFIDAEITVQGKVILECRPHFGDSRSFILVSESPELAEAIKKHAEYFKGSYFIHDAVFQSNYRFEKLQSVELLKIGSKRLVNNYSWTTDKLQGTTAFLIP